jgi:hypothetical protein
VEAGQQRKENNQMFIVIAILVVAVVGALLFALTPRGLTDFENDVSPIVAARHFDNPRR